MTEPLDDQPSHPPSWGKLQETIHSWLVLRFGLNTPRDKDIWLLCIGAAMELERLAVAVLWISEGRPKPFYEYEEKMTLGQAHRELERRSLLDTTTRKIIQDVAALRNSVAHRHAVFVTAQSPIAGLSIGEYKGRQVFVHREALHELILDSDAAMRVMFDWMNTNAPDLAEQARRWQASGGAGAVNPTPP